jgi:histidine triad (HIT) family protein
MSSIFSKILSGDIPGQIVAQNESFFAILDINPLVMGHTLVIPKKETDYIFDLDAIELGQFFQFAQHVAKSIESVVDCQRVGVAVIGLEVPHAHIHLVPMQSMDDINFSRPKLQPGNEALAEMGDKLRASII